MFIANSVMVIFILIVLITCVNILINIFVLKNKYNIVAETYSNDEIKESSINITASDIDIYLINLKWNKDRYKNFLKLYNSTDLSPIGIKTVEAVEGKKIDDIRSLVSEKAYTELIDAERLGYRTKHYQITRGAIGCYLSHLNTYELIVNSDKDFAIIFEDDVKFNTSNILQEIQEKIKVMPSDWDLMLLGCVCYVCHKYDHYYDASKFILLHGYIIKKSSAKKIIELLKDKPIEKQIDSKFSDLILEGKLKVYCLKEQLAVQNNIYNTNIQLPIKRVEGVNPFADL